ncbi:hypothetical protein SUDANB145_07259 (plasmid) [Streptomyces sp. enrichment culture]|uniref:hypothetical protein n=1 Tax=Streptomyces sp. enrichment culture TaxID=1795815 RepID=UPI003F55337F
MPTDTPPLENRLRLAHQARRAKEHQLDDIRRALCDVGIINDDDPYGHADLADVIRQSKPAESAIMDEPEPVAPKPYPLTSPEWHSQEGHTRCGFRMNTGDGRLQCTFRAGHPPHGHSLNAKNPGTPSPEMAPEEDTEGIDEVATALFEILSAFSPVSSHTGIRLGWTLPAPIAEADYNRWMAALTEGGS